VNYLAKWHSFFGAKHARPELDELRFIETPVAVGVEHFDHVEGSWFIKAHSFFYHLYQLVGGENTITVRVYLSKVGSNFFVTK